MFFTGKNTNTNLLLFKKCNLLKTNCIRIFFIQIGESFRLRSLKFPGIISGCIIDWYTAWPRDALIAVSHHFLNDFPMISTAETKESLIELLGEIHEYVRKDCTSYFQRYGH